MAAGFVDVFRMMMGWWSSVASSAVYPTQTFIISDVSSFTIDDRSEHIINDVSAFTIEEH